MIQDFILAIQSGDARALAECLDRSVIWSVGGQPAFSGSGPSKSFFGSSSDDYSVVDGYTRITDQVHVYGRARMSDVWWPANVCYWRAKRQTHLSCDGA